VTALSHPPDRARARAPDFEPAYRRLLATGELARRVERAGHHMRSCDLCARYCRIDRTRTIKGAACRTGTRAVVASYGPHFGEEDCLRGVNGSGTIFFSHCNMRCVFCQNWEISWQGEGQERSAEELADMMMQLQDQGCHNINLVGPSHVVAQILEALAIAAPRGLSLPLVYNSGGYDSLEALALLDGVVDIYMPDVKYGDSDAAHSYSHVRNYAGFNKAALAEMHRQVGDLVIDEQGIAQRGLLVRHLVMPNGLATSDQIFRFLAEEISPATYINIMDQYRPCYKAGDTPELARRLTHAEYTETLAAARRYGLTRLDDAFADPRAG